MLIILMTFIMMQKFLNDDTDDDVLNDVVVDRG
jgi:hypothetical protein